MIPSRYLLDQYRPVLAGLNWKHAPRGFSGAEVWRGEDEEGNPLFALKKWPRGFPESRLAEIHSWIMRAVHLPFVPAILHTTSQQTLVRDSDFLWDVTRWMPGAPLASPTPTEIQIACGAVAKLHSALRVESRREPCRGVLHRLQIIKDWQANASRLRFSRGTESELSAIFERAERAVNACIPSVLEALEPWERPPLPAQPCVRDLRGEHILFSEGTVTGILDFGAAAVDYPGVDLARLLGDLAGNDHAKFAAGLAAYRGAGGILDEDDQFVRLLERSGAVCSVIGWMFRLGKRLNMAEDAIAIRSRIATLLDRIE